jgi:bacillithiol biosynthesis cysteine-adding enzyme BshC
VRANSTELASAADDTPTRVAVDLRRFPWIRRLAADYAYDFHAVAPFFSGDPAEWAAWVPVIERAQAHVRRRADIAAVIAGQQARRGAPEAARAAGAKLANTETVAIVTGQQAGLFGGPLFTLLKALTALKLAARVAQEHHVPCTAIFWIDAEDHDWDEVRSCTVFDDTISPQTVSLPPHSADEPLPVAETRLDASITAALDDLERLLPATEFRPEIVATLRRTYAPGVGMADAFGAWLEQLLGDRGLVVFDSSDPAAKPLASRIFTQELAMPGETARRAAQAGSDLVARGYHSQVHAQHDTPALFHLRPGRRSIRQQDGHFLIGEEPVALAAVQQEAAEQPAGFSPNVLLRPIVQDTLFPTVCYVAGPNELAYLGQLRGVYEHFGVPMPLMYPRATATLLDSAAMRFLTKYDVPLESLQAQDEAALNALLTAQIPQSVETAFADASAVIDAQMARLIEAIPAIDPTLENTARSTLGRMQHDLHTLHGKMISAAKRRDETLRRQFIRTRALAFPDGHAQERTIGFVSFLNQYGPSLVDRLDVELPLELGRHWIITI